MVKAVNDDAQNPEKDLYRYDEEFRNSISTVDASGKRVWLYPRKPSGALHNKRILVTIILLSIFFAGPFLKIGGQPFLLLDFFERRFVIFGQPFWPQDFVLLAIMLITFFVFVILFTVVFGRIWCGWMCPQTLFMEMVFRKIEYWIEGDAPAQRRLNSEPLNVRKFAKKTFKHAIFIMISLVIAHTAMAYIIGLEKSMAVISEPPMKNIGGFLGMVAFTGIFYGVFARFREQACIAVCPYGRLQDVLLGKDSIVVAYDWLRGEPRSHLKKAKPSSAEPHGDCIDCKLCVHVCPTGIDIRNGTQLECVNCTACIDACDQVMTKIHKPTGLIRFSSQNAIKSGVQKIFQSRVAGYSIVLLLLLGILAFSLMTRSDVETTVLKVPGTLYQRTEDGFITNLYNIEFVNKTFDEIRLDLKIEEPSTAQLSKADGKTVVIPPEGFVKGIYFISIPQEHVVNARTTVMMGVYRDGKRIEKLKVKFIGPVGRPSDAKR